MPTNDVNTLDSPHLINASQRRAAQVVGALYLILMVTGAFAQLYVPGSFPGGATGTDDAMETARAVVDSERLLRLGTVVDLLTNAGDVVLAVAYYVLLSPVSRGLALLGAFWWLADTYRGGWQRSGPSRPRFSPPAV